MARWSPWGATKKYRVKLKSIRLHGFAISGAELARKDEEVAAQGERVGGEEIMSNSNKVAVVEVKWKGPTKKSGLFVPFPTKKFRNVSKEAVIGRNGDPLVWEEDEFEHVCNFSIVSSASSSSSTKDDANGKNSFGPWLVSFHLLVGEKGEESKKKTRDVGKATVDLAELLNASQMDEAEINHPVPIDLQFDGRPSRQATVSIVVSFAEMRELHSRSNSSDSVELIPSSEELSGPQDSFMMRARSFGLSRSKKKRTKKSGLSGAYYSSNSEESDSATWSEKGGDSSSETRLDVSEDKNFSFWPWRRRNKASFKRAKTRDPHDSQLKLDHSEPPRGKEEITSTSDCGSWELKELVSRDARTKLKAKVFFASYDQRSEKAAGESACTAIVAMFAHWLQSNPDTMPTRAIFDQLIAEGSSEWRRLCKDESRKSKFHDCHFDLDTVLDAELKPLAIVQERSHVGFFSPEKFELLKEAKSFDDIWNEINEGKQDGPSFGIYIVSWNDHFFVLKVGSDACYIMDSLGERLHEGCDRAYILEFDESTVMYGRVAKQGDGSDEEKGNKDEQGNEEVICTGKECCREYMKRFLAAIAIRELKEEEDKGTIFAGSLHQRLQIEFHYSSASAHSASTSVDENSS